jgi:threonine dehydrogenase-like Zn-dependent dehydrogenase
VYIVGGHEGVGIVHKLGPGADLISIKVGDRVGIKVLFRHLFGSGRYSLRSSGLLRFVLLAWPAMNSLMDHAL